MVQHMQYAAQSTGFCPHATFNEGNQGGTMKLQRFTICFFLLLLVAAGAFAQGTTGALTGTVTQAGANLPGVPVSISSPTVQGTRTTVPNQNDRNLVLA